MKRDGLQSVALLCIMFGSFGTLIAFTGWSPHVCLILSFLSTLPVGYAFKINNGETKKDQETPKDS